MNAATHIKSLTNWNAKQSIRQNLMTNNNRETLKSALKRADDIKWWNLFGKALMIKSN